MYIISPIQGWDVTVIEPLVNGIVRDLVNLRVLPKLDDDRYKYAPDNLETPDNNNARENTGNMLDSSGDIVHIGYNVRRTNKTGMGVTTAFRNGQPIFQDEQGNVTIVPVSYEYDIRLTISIDSSSKEGIFQLGHRIVDTVNKTGGDLVHDLNCNYSIPSKIMEVLDEVLYYRNEYDREVTERKIAKIKELNSLPNGHPDRPIHPIHVPEEFKPLDMEHYLGAYSIGNLRTRYNINATLQEPMIILPYVGLVGSFNTERDGVEFSSSKKNTLFHTEFEYRLLLTLPRDLAVVYPITVYNSIVSDRLVRPAKTIGHTHLLTNSPEIALVHDLDVNNRRKEGEYTKVVTIPEEDVELPQVQPKGYKLVGSWLLNLDLDDRTKLININSEEDGLIDLNVLEWLRDGEYKHFTTYGASGLYLGLMINDTFVLNALESDEDLNITSKTPLGPMNTIRVGLYVVKDILNLPDNALARVKCSDYMYETLIAAWVQMGTITKEVAEFLLTLSITDKVGSFSTLMQPPEVTCAWLREATVSEITTITQQLRFGLDRNVRVDMENLFGVNWLAKFVKESCPDNE